MNACDVNQPAAPPSLPRLAQTMLNSIVWKLHFISMGCFASRIVCVIMFHADLNWLYILSPLVFCGVSQLFARKEINSTYDYSMVVYGIKISLQLVCFVVNLQSPKDDLHLDILVFVKMMSIMDEFQLFSDKFELPVTLCTYISTYLILIPIYYHDFIQTDRLAMLATGLIVEIYYARYYKGIKYHLIQNLSQVKKLESRWQKLLKNLKVGITIIQRDTLKLTFINDAMLHIFDLQNRNDDSILEELSTITMIYQDGRIKKEISFSSYVAQKLKELEMTDQSELRNSVDFYKLKSRKCDIEVTFQVCCEEEGLLLIMVSDITSSRQLQKKKQIERMKTVYFCSVAHDLKNPINSIMVTNDRMLDTFKHEDKLLKMFRITKSSCQFLLRIIQDITDLSKIELKSFQVEEDWFCLRELLLGVSDMMSFPFQMKGLCLDFEILDRALDTDNAVVYSDQKRVAQILHNLIGNALKFTMKGRVRVAVGIVSEREEMQEGMQQQNALEEQLPAVEEDGGEMMEEEKEEGSFGTSTKLIFKVSDTGVGISEESQSQLFQLFGKMKEHRDVNRHGIGLGLTICKKLSELLGGSISVQSELGKGTTFSFTIKCRVNLNDTMVTESPRHSIDSGRESMGFVEEYMKPQEFGFLHDL